MERKPDSNFSRFINHVYLFFFNKFIYFMILFYLFIVSGRVGSLLLRAGFSLVAASGGYSLQWLLVAEHGL